MSEKEKNAQMVRTIVAQADTDGLDRFMAQYSRATVAEFLIGDMPPPARVQFLRHMLARYAAELNGGVPS